MNFETWENQKADSLGRRAIFRQKDREKVFRNRGAPRAKGQIYL
jgi:hypothetical protein